MLEVSELVKTFVGGKKALSQENVAAVENVTFNVPQGQFFTLLGPSGCGKTTTLRCIAGLEDPDSGTIAVDGRTLFDSSRAIQLMPNERGLGMVFQSYAIWPHMSVFQNVAYPLCVGPRARRPSRAQVRERVERVLHAVQLDELLDRPATDLSGGQQQRLAFARALVHEPALLLLDEPLSNLDAKLREGMRSELRRLTREIGITAVYVTHDQVEALTMSNQIAVMNAGSIEQVGAPRDIYQKPQSRFVADFIGTTNLVDGWIVSREGQLFHVSTGHGDVRIASDADFAAGDAVVVSIRPEHIEIDQSLPTITEAGIWLGTIEARVYLGESVDHVVSVGGREIQVRCHQSTSLPPGTEVALRIADELCTLIPADRLDG